MPAATAAAFGTPPPPLVLTGGDSLRRLDIAQLVAPGTARGISVSLTPSGTAAVTEVRLHALQEAGLARLAVSLDGATEAVHARPAAADQHDRVQLQPAGHEASAP